MLLSFVCFIFFDALIIYIFDPAISTYRDAVWYCYGVISTTGFGDVVVSTPVGRACSVILTIYSTLVIAIVTGVIVSHRDRKKYERLQDAHIELMEDYANTMEEFTDYIRGKNGCDREDFIFEEDNEDE